MTLVICALSTIVSALVGFSAPTVWQPSHSHHQVPIWPSSAPDARVTGPESAATVNDPIVAGKPWIQVGPVSRPTMTVYAPKNKTTGVAAIVLPGGGYQVLAIDLEGTEICDWLTSRGITCVLLKYRVPGENRFPKSGPYPDSRIALEDAKRTVGLVRYRAASWHIDPREIGVLGFSAGGHMAAALSVHFAHRLFGRGCGRQAELPSRFRDSNLSGASLACCQ